MKLSAIFRTWAPLSITFTLIFGTIYVVAQQNYRISANDPQIQIAEDLSSQLSQGQNPGAFVPSSKIDISKSLSLFVLIYDKNGKLVDSSALMDGKVPELPSGVFTRTKELGETRFTWQPKEGVRIALVVDYYKGANPGFVAVGRSLREVEKRVDNLSISVLLAFLVTSAVSFAAVWFFSKFK